MYYTGIITFLLAPLLFPFLVRSTILLTVEGDAVLDVYKPVSWTRLATDPETFLLVNVVLDADATHGTQELLRTNGTTSGTSQVVAHFPGTHHVFAFLNSTSVVANDPPLATSNDFGVNPAPKSSTSLSIEATAETSIPPTVVTITASPTPSKAASHSNTPAIVGGVVGAAVVIALILIAIWYFLRRRKATVKIDTTTRPFTSQTSNHAPHPMTPFRTEKSGTRFPSAVPRAYTVSESASHRPQASSSRSEHSIFTSVGTEVGRHQTLPSLPGSILPELPASETGRVAVRLDEAVAEIANLRGELQSLRDRSELTWTSYPASDISPPSYEYSRSPRR